jgi:hypothetical protein
MAEAAIIIGTVKLTLKLLETIKKTKQNWDFQKSPQFQSEVQALGAALEVYRYAEDMFKEYVNESRKETLDNQRAHIKRLVDMQHEAIENVQTSLDKLNSQKSPTLVDSALGDTIQKLRDARSKTYNAVDNLRCLITFSKFLTELNDEKEGIVLKSVEDPEARMFWLHYYGPDVPDVAVDVFAMDYIKYLNFYHDPNTFKVKQNVMQKIIKNCVGKWFGLSFQLRRLMGIIDRCK